MQIIEDQKDNLDAGLRIKLYGMIMEEGYNNNSRLGVGNTMNLVDAIKIFEEKIDFTEISNNQKLQAEIKPFIYAIVMKTYYNLGEYTQVLKIKDHILPKSFVDDDVSGKEKSNSEIDVNINTNLYVNESNSNLTSSDSGSGSYTDTDTRVGVDINNIRERSIPAAVFDMVMSSLLKVDEVIEAMQFLEKLKRYQSQQHFTVSESVYAKLLDHFGAHLSESVTAIYLIRALGTLEKRLFNNNSLIYMYQYKSTNSDSEVGNNSKSLTSDNYGMQVVNAYYYLKNINNNNSNDNNDTLSLQFYASLCFAYASTGDITMAFQTLELVLYRYQQLLSTLDNKMAQLQSSPQSLQSKALKTNPELETPANYYTLFNPQTYNYGANIDNIHNTKRSLDYMFKTLVDCCIYCDFQNDEHLFALLRSAALSQQQQRQQKNIQETIKNNGPSANTNSNANANLNANTKNNTDMDNDGDGYGDGDQAFNISENDIDNDNDIDNLEFVKFVEQQTLKMDFGSNNVEKYTILFSKPSVDIKTTKNPNFNLNLNLNLDLGFGFGFGKAGNSGSGDTKRHHKYAVDNGNGHDKFRYFYLLDGVANHIYDLTNIHKPSTQAVPDSASYSTGINGYDSHLLLITSIFEAQVRFGNYQIAVDFLLSNSGSFADNSESEKWREYAVNLLGFAAKFVDLGEPSTKLADQNSALFQLNRLTSSLPSSSLPSSSSLSSSTSTSPSTLTL
ncbi:hypothetical protein AX774_g4900 [Zancudomyces culisetae]|uniref:Uncharacterized protein n=1 Tax=Zancudomyces culisetae TaxID=1213189 RepID=A0A1R1PL53_ZANCU|nr:hypothetical protein AX774_g4900 [Zancudomyces culisetae]|eukprot:OMH81653.1 hypothetical protein AX774_g4900 [Zancudomyces culisetae]